ncbi:MAG: sigma-54-dependent Fis family transcriptional regulator [Acidobacteria bacterium]|uniref:Sigma-54-dependent Fis family transcriptional regulator n=1 Tax=Candidatus Polarisedimenticola svalbardensis TaxID=2886004 RepID=A0A8J6Y2C3_9BACT|nr:sigma-54-dependent Fis family transcriptional regulator [Candidatus Polarisedimenticola svalbardensis]
MSRKSRSATHLLVVDDEGHQREMLASLLGRAGYQVSTAVNGEEALAQVNAGEFDLVLTDQRMPVMDGIQLLERLQADCGNLPVVLMTAYGSVSSAVQAMKYGAADYLTKPFDKDELIVVVEKVLRHRRLEDEVAQLHGVLQDRFRVGGIIGSSPPMQDLFNMIQRLASTDVPVLIEGESGTGKELVARAIHQEGTRASGPFIATNCAAIPESLMESEFFGHDRGAFTGAENSRAGFFEQADGGTLFLDEVGAMRIDLQAKLLRVLQDKVVQRLGSTVAKQVNVRILAATCEDLGEAIRNKTFRDDLYYRLSVVPVRLPPLRERTEDIPLLVEHFLGRASSRFGRDDLALMPEVMDRMMVHPWPGNVRELENCIERMVLMAPADRRLSVKDLPPALVPGSGGGARGDGEFSLPAGGVNLQELEEKLIRQALTRTRGALRPAASLLGISYKTLQYRIKKYGLDRIFVPEK